MLIIRKGNLTWYIHDNYILLLVFIVTFCVTYLTTLTVIKVIKSILKFIKKLKIERKINKQFQKNKMNVKGGDIVDCIAIDGVYEVQDPSLILTIRDMLKLGIPKNPLFLEVSILFMAYVYNNRHITTLFHKGLQIYFEQASDFSWKLGFGLFYTVLAALITGLVRGTNICLSLSSPAVVGFVVSCLAAYTYATSNINCNDFFSKLPQFEQSRLSYIDSPQISNQKIFVKGEKELKIYQLKEEINLCTEEKSLDKEIDNQFAINFDKRTNQKVETINKECHTEKKYIPLKHRTRTLNDIRRHDDSETREKAEPLIKRYQQRREKIKANRQKEKE